MGVYLIARHGNKRRNECALTKIGSINFVARVILESSASFAKSPIKRLAVHKVQPALALLSQLCKIRSNLLRIRILRNLPDCKIP